MVPMVPYSETACNPHSKGSLFRKKVFPMVPYAETGLQPPRSNGSVFRDRKSLVVGYEVAIIYPPLR